MAVIALAQFMVIADTSIIGVALPDIRADLSFSPEDLSWVFNAYQVGSALGLAAMTALVASQGADRLGHLGALTNGYSAAFLGAAGIAVAGGLVAAVTLRRRGPRSRTPPRRTRTSANSSPPDGRSGSAVQCSADPDEAFLRPRVARLTARPRAVTSVHRAGPVPPARQGPPSTQKTASGAVFIGDRGAGQRIESYSLNSGRYIEMTMNPTMPPTTTSMIGSRIEVSALTDASTWSS